jgi:hypothetical protein
MSVNLKRLNGYNLMVTVQKFTSNIQSVLCQSPDVYWHAETVFSETALSIVPNSDYVIMISDLNCLKYFCLFLYGNHQVHRDFDHPVLTALILKQLTIGKIHKFG